jgi:uncharacterized protein
MAEIERRAVLELRAAGRKLTGVAAPFNTIAHVNGFDERIAPGAFSATLAENRDVIATADHDGSRLLARTKNGSLRLRETQRGLEFDLDVPDTTLGRDVLTMTENGLVGGASFSFRVRPAGEKWDGIVRELRALDLVEIAIVSSFPAYSETQVFARSMPPIKLCMARRYLETI